MIVTGPYLPLDVNDPTELAARRLGMFTVEVGIPSLEITTIADHDLKLIGWDRTKQVLSFRSSRNENLIASAAQAVRYRKRGSHWEMLTGADLKSDSTPDITVDQDLNQPPPIVAVDPQTGRGGVFCGTSIPSSMKLLSDMWRRSHGVEAGAARFMEAYTCRPITLRASAIL